MKGWYAGLLGGLLPILLLGFGYSALADRTAFVLWALGLAVAWVLVLRQGMEAGLRRLLLAGWLLLLLAAGLAGFAGGRPKAQEIVAYWPALLAREEVEGRIEVTVEEA